MAGLDIITNHPMLTGTLVVGGFCLWKFILQPIMNEGQPLDPNKEQVDGFKVDMDLGELNKA